MSTTRKKEQCDRKTYRHGRGAKLDGGGKVPCPACTGEPVRSIGVRDVMCHHCDGDGYVPREEADIIERQLKLHSEPAIGGGPTS